MRLLTAITLLGVVLVPHSAFSQSVEKGQALCYQIEKTVNALVDYTQTSCLPTKGKSPETHSFILLSNKPVFSTEASKKGWVIAAIAATGDALNKNASVRADELWLSDTTQMKTRIVYVMPAAMAKSLQRKVKGDQITVDGMYSEIIKNLDKRNLPKR
jgi:hypothetical protein